MYIKVYRYLHVESERTEIHTGTASILCAYIHIMIFNIMTTNLNDV